MNAAQSRIAKARQSAHTPEARAKAALTNGKLTAIRYDLARKFNALPPDFTKAKLLGTVERLHIPVRELPELLLASLPVSVRKQLLAKRGNGQAHDMSGGVGIPLDAIPERKPNAASAEGKPRGPYNTTRGHPNAQLIEKVIDLLARPDLTEAVVDRLVRVLDKLIA